MVSLNRFSTPRVLLGPFCAMDSAVWSPTVSQSLGAFWSCPFIALLVLKCKVSSPCPLCRVCFGLAGSLAVPSLGMFESLNFSFTTLVSDIQESASLLNFLPSHCFFSFILLTFPGVGSKAVLSFSVASSASLLPEDVKQITECLGIKRPHLFENLKLSFAPLSRVSTVEFNAAGIMDAN